MIRGPNRSIIGKIAVMLVMMFVLLFVSSISATQSNVATQANTEMILLGASTQQTFEAPLPTTCGVCFAAEASMHSQSLLTPLTGNSGDLSQERNTAQTVAGEEAPFILANCPPVNDNTMNSATLILLTSRYSSVKETAITLRSTRAEMQAGGQWTKAKGCPGSYVSGYLGKNYRKEAPVAFARV